MQRLLIAVLATATLLTAPTVAYATAAPTTTEDRATKWRDMEDQTTTGAKWRNAEYRFLPPGKETRGAFHFRGTLSSLNKDNGTYLEVAVHGYSPNVFRTARGKSKKHNHYVYDGAAQRTKDARVRVCRDRGTLIPDNCSEEERYLR